MSLPILQLTYISSRHPDLAPTEVERILSAARLNNRRSGVTGFLLFNGHRFLQHLEGPEAAVMETFERIRRDPRHRALVELGRKEAESRAFSNWAMAFERIDSVLPERRQPLAAQVETMLAGVHPHIANHFLGYARLTGGKAA